eukprot:scaffold154702_cov27-Tisochrysis_lutea.AAC.1
MSTYPHGGSLLVGPPQRGATATATECAASPSLRAKRPVSPLPRRQTQGSAHGSIPRNRTKWNEGGGAERGVRVG